MRIVIESNHTFCVVSESLKTSKYAFAIVTPDVAFGIAIFDLPIHCSPGISSLIFVGEYVPIYKSDAS